MATTQEIKDSKRAELDVLLVENGLDPADYSTVTDAKEALLPFATDVEDQGEGDGDGEGDQAGEGDVTDTTTPAVDDAEKAADKAEEFEVKPTDVVPSGHAEHFDEFGQPVFGNAKKAKK